MKENGKSIGESRLTRICRTCGETIRYTSVSSRNLAERRNTECSSCANKRIGEMKKLGRVVVVCDYCGATFKKQPHQVSTHNYCSRTCLYNSRKGEDRGGTIKLVCEMCGLPFKRYRYLIKEEGPYFCSNDCYSTYRSIHGNTPFTGPTKPELYFREILEELKITYKPYKRITHPKYGNCYYDFYFEESNLVIEIDGDYWHGNPSIYTKLNKQQQQAKQRDREKELVLKQKGIILKRIWETDLYKLSKIEIEQLIK